MRQVSNAVPFLEHWLLNEHCRANAKERKSGTLGRMFGPPIQFSGAKHSRPCVTAPISLFKVASHWLSRRSRSANDGPP